MADTVLLFFAGALAVVALSKVANIWPGRWPPGSTAKRLMLLILSAVVVGMPLGWFAWAPLKEPDLFDYWPYIYWIILGRAIALLIGCLAGFVLVAALGAINRWGPGADLKSIVILAAGPLLTILALYLLAVPGARQSLGLTGIKAGDFEITLAAPATNLTNPAPVNSFSPIPAGGEALGDYTGWFNNMWPMFVKPKSITSSAPPAKDFLQRGYFEREKAYLDYVTAINWDNGDPEPTKRHQQAVKALKRQRDFIWSLRPIIGCVGFYHIYFPDVAAAGSIIAPFLEALIGLEKHREQTSPLSIRPAATTFEGTQELLSQQAFPIINQVNTALLPLSGDPSWSAQPDETAPKPSWGDCTAQSPWFRIPSPPAPDDDDLEPPYLAMAVANAYGALGQKRAGLDVLNKWIIYYDKYEGSHPDAPIWFYDRAVFEYGVIQEVDEPFPTSTAELFYLKKTKALLDKDWRVDLENEGYLCGSAGYLTAKRQFDQQTDDPDEQGMKARLNLVYANVLGRLLLATVATRSGVGSDLITREHEAWARQLLASAERCLIGEQEHPWRIYRQTFDRVAAGMLLARWSVDGPRVGLLGSSAAVEARTQALHALADAMRSIPSLEHDASSPEGLRLIPTEWGSIRRMVEKEMLDLEASLAN